MNLDILTPRGQESVTQEQTLIRSFEAHFTEYKVTQTPKEKPSAVDGIIHRNGRIEGIFESKCRDATREQMRGWNDEWLVTFEKIRLGAELARNLCVKFTGLIYLTKSPVGLCVLIADEQGNIVPRVRLERTVTQKTINGGSIIRTNAYIDISDAKEFPIL
jgi:hypothetical protein